MMFIFFSSNRMFLQLIRRIILENIMMLGKQSQHSQEQEQNFSLPRGNQEVGQLVENCVNEERQKFEQTYQGSHHRRTEQVDAKQLISPFIKGNPEHCTFKLRASKANPTIHSKISQDKNMTFNHASKVSEQNLHKKSFKHVNSYEQLMDKNLIQYLYTRQNKIFQPETPANPLESNCKTQHIRTRKLVKKSPIDMLARKLKLSRKESQPFQVRNDCGRKIEYNTFDAFSYEQSMKQYSSKSYKHMRLDQPRQQKSNKPELIVFKQRINKLEESVFHKVPFLIEMGVKFKHKQ